MLDAWKDGTELEHYHEVLNCTVRLDFSEDPNNDPLFHIIETGASPARSVASSMLNVDFNTYIAPAVLAGRKLFRWEGVLMTFEEWQARGVDQNSTVQFV
jgi:hypothetical protein